MAGSATRRRFPADAAWLRGTDARASVPPTGVRMVERDTRPSIDSLSSGSSGWDPCRAPSDAPCAPATSSRVPSRFTPSQRRTGVVLAGRQHLTPESSTAARSALLRHLRSPAAFAGGPRRKGGPAAEELRPPATGRAAPPTRQGLPGAPGSLKSCAQQSAGTGRGPTPCGRSRHRRQSSCRMPLPNTCAVRQSGGTGRTRALAATGPTLHGLAGASAPTWCTSLTPPAKARLTPPGPLWRRTRHEGNRLSRCSRRQARRLR